MRKNHNHGLDAVLVGSGAVAILCVAGILTRNINYFAAVLGFICGDEMGKTAGWH